MRRRSVTALVVLAAALGTGCAWFDSAGLGPTEAFDAHRPSAIRIVGPWSGAAVPGSVERVREAVAARLAAKGYTVARSAGARLQLEIDAWGEQAGFDGRSLARVALSGVLVANGDGAELWRGRGRASELEEEDVDPWDAPADGLLDGLLDAAIQGTGEPWSSDSAELVDEAVAELLDSLPDAPRAGD